MISPRQAIQSATAFLTDIYGDTGARHIRVEELEMDEQEPIWHVTLSYYPPPEKPSLSDQMLSVLGPERIYKTFEVFSEDGTIRSMKIRELQ